jgi:colicin import membrane protein
LHQLEEEGRRRAEQARAIAELSAAAEARKASPASSTVAPHPVRPARESWADEHEKPYVRPYALGRSHAEDRIETRSPGITRVTVLLVMEPGRRGIRRFNKTADPILCVGAGCYISNGAGAPSQVMRRAKAFGPVVAIGLRAGKCSRSLTCVFRSVDLERPRSEVQPIDLRILRHDRRKPSIVMADPTCRTDGKRLTCSRTVVADDYRMWIVPESVAERAGAVALESAVLNGLRGDGNVARAGSG